MPRPEERQPLPDYRHMVEVSRGMDVPDEPDGYHSHLTMVKSPNKWSCVPAAFAMIAQCDLNELIAEIGHDGSRVIWPDREESQRGFCLSEVFIAMYNLGYYCLEFPLEYEFPDPGAEGIGAILEKTPFRIPMHDVVMLGEIRSTNKLHAWAWDSKKCLDPDGIVRDLEYYNLHSFIEIHEV